jgi:hypothetical protein
MNDRSFIKLFSSIVTSSIWNQESDHRVVWITMLALANSHGQVLSTLGALARIANVPPEVCQAAVESFLAPDADSRTKDDDGRRIRVIDGGWELVNYELYRQMLSDEERREYQAEYYLKRKQAKDLRGVNNRQQSSSLSREAEAEAEAEAHTQKRARDSSFAELTTVRQAINAMFAQPTRRWTEPEERAIGALSARPEFSAEWATIEAHHQRLVAADKRYFPQSVTSLLAKWAELLDRARNYVPTMTPGQIADQQRSRAFIDRMLK